MMWRKWPSFERAWSRNNTEEILPSAGWAQDSNSHYLLISLPGFEQEDIKIQVEDDPGRINIIGQRKKKKKKSLVGTNSINFFNKTYNIPDNNADITSASGKLDGEIFTVTISKKKSPPPLTVDQEEEHHQVAADKVEHVEKESDTKSLPHCCSDQDKRNKLDQNKHSGVEGDEDKNHQGGGAADAINKNKGMIFTLLTAFTLGILVSRKVESHRRCNYKDKLPNSLLNT